MNIRFTARHFDASSRLKEYSTDAVSKLENFYDRIVSCSIVLQPDPSDETPQRAEITITIPNTTLKASEAADKYEQAVLMAVDNLSRQLKRYKEKKFQSH